MVIQEPSLNGGELTYAIETLDGTVPDRAGPVTLFTAVAGVGGRGAAP